MFTYYWHNLLNMPKESEFWHKTDIQDEVLEYREAKGFFATWSEIADVVYTHTRAKWSGFGHFRFPLRWYHYPIGLIYMYPKYTLRWLFFRKVARMFGKHEQVHEVRNPKKMEKLHVLAEKYGIDKDRFVAECRKLLTWWPLLK